jgi:hypothetical protein
MNKSFLGLSVGSMVASALLLPGKVLAQATGGSGNTSGGVAGGLGDIERQFPTTRFTNQSPLQVIGTVIDYALYFAAIFAVLYIIYGGYMYITSAGDSKKAGTGRDTLTNALIGLVLIIFAYVIVQVVYRFAIGN